VEADADKDATITGKDEFMKSWDAEFVKVDKNTLFDLILVRLSVSFFQDFFS
jgi:S-phase kinase-associated protein 1